MYFCRSSSYCNSFLKGGELIKLFFLSHRSCNRHIYVKRLINISNTNNGSLTYRTTCKNCRRQFVPCTPAHIVDGDNSCRRQYVPATIYAPNIGIKCRRRQFMPGDNLCRNTIFRQLFLISCNFFIFHRNRFLSFV